MFFKSSEDGFMLFLNQIPVPFVRKNNTYVDKIPWRGELLTNIRENRHVFGGSLQITKNNQ